MEYILEESMLPLGDHQADGGSFTSLAPSCNGSPSTKGTASLQATHRVSKNGRTARLLDFSSLETVTESDSLQMKEQLQSMLNLAKGLF